MRKRTKEELLNSRLRVSWIHNEMSENVYCPWHFEDQLLRKSLKDFYNIITKKNYVKLIRFRVYDTKMYILKKKAHNSAITLSLLQ